MPCSGVVNKRFVMGQEVSRQDANVAPNGWGDPVMELEHNFRERDDSSYLSSAQCVSYYVWYAAVIIYVFVMCWAHPRDPTEKAPGDLFELNKGDTTKYLSELWEKHWHYRSLFTCSPTVVLIMNFVIQIATTKCDLARL
ncbi:hypothetical protein OSTOST_16367 [Ostertagia ostertagi]